ncbi:MAG: hypothetical protein GYB65_23290 [Chloroflexi bacterium]|nr:hypothetical protein [Chloroflexota bacterium]
MSHQEDPSERKNSSLLRRLLHGEEEPPAPEDDAALENEPAAPDARLSPIPGVTVEPEKPDSDEKRSTSRLSPIRPSQPDETEPQEPLIPSMPYRAPTEPLSPREQMQRAEEALIGLREKMARVAAEYAEGKLNSAQFDAIYTRYSEQRDITERLLSRDPESQAWQSVVQPGHTTFLKEYYAARVISYAFYHLDTARLITVTGPVQMERSQVMAVITRLRDIIAERGNPGSAARQLGDGRCVLFVPGEITVAVIILSVEPAATQITRVEDMHADFERANARALQNRDFNPERMVFPHRALFEENR